MSEPASNDKLMQEVREMEEKRKTLVLEQSLKMPARVSFLQTLRQSTFRSKGSINFEDHHFNFKALTNMSSKKQLTK